jgi:cytochrome c oxidase subunit 4
MNLLNWLFIILTLVKAYYIVWAFMHMEGETKSLRRSVVWTVIFLYYIYIYLLLTEGNYVLEFLKILQLNGIFNTILIQLKGPDFHRDFFIFVL